MVGEFFAADVESIEGIGAVCAVFKEVFFCLGEFFAPLSFLKPLRPRVTPADWMAKIKSSLF